MKMIIIVIAKIYRVLTLCQAQCQVLYFDSRFILTATTYNNYYYSQFRDRKNEAQGPTSAQWQSHDLNPGIHSFVHATWVQILIKTYGTRFQEVQV